GGTEGVGEGRGGAGGLREVGVKGFLNRMEAFAVHALLERPAANGREGLTPREVEVLALVAQGESNRGIADRLVISEKTAIRHVSNIFVKLGVHTRAEATRVALEGGLIPPLDEHP